MKILYFVEEKNNLMYKWQEFHIFSELKRHGVEIEVFNYLAFSSTEESNKALLNRVKKADVDLFMTPFNETKLLINTLKTIKTLGIPTLLICFDNLVIPFFHRKICKYFDLVWLTSRETEFLFKRWEARTIFLPYAANPELFTPNKEIRNINKICFVGTPYGSRVNMINALLQGRVSVDLFSSLGNTSEVKAAQKFRDYLKPFFNLIRFSYGRKVIFGAIKNKLIKPPKLNAGSLYLELFEPVQLEQLGEVYSSYALSLSSTSARNTGVLKKPLDIVNLRSFEIPMAGGIQVCKYNEELASYFTEDEEIIFYHNEVDLVRKINFYLLPENKERLYEMKCAARARAIREHTWFHRFSEIFKSLNLDYKS